MKVPESYSRAWFEWRRAALPREDGTGARLDLDHLASYLAGIGQVVEISAAGGFTTIAADQLAKLHAIETAVDVEVPAERRTPYDEYIAATRRLLRELAQLGGG